MRTCTRLLPRTPRFPVKVSVGAGPVNLAWHAYFNHYKDAKELSYALAPIFNAEMKELVAAGAKYLQIEDLGAWMPLFTGDKAYYTWIKDVIAQCCDGVNAKIGWHFCFGNAWGNDLISGAFPEGYQTVLPHFFDTPGINEFVLDYANRNMAGVEFLKNLPKDKTVQVGVLDVRSNAIESPETIAARIKKVIAAVSPDRGGAEHGLWHEAAGANGREDEAQRAGAGREARFAPRSPGSGNIDAMSRTRRSLAVAASSLAGVLRLECPLRPPARRRPNCRAASGGRARRRHAARRHARDDRQVLRHLPQPAPANGRPRARSAGPGECAGARRRLGESDSKSAGGHDAARGRASTRRGRAPGAARIARIHAGTRPLAESEPRPPARASVESRRVRERRSRSAGARRRRDVHAAAGRLERRIRQQRRRARCLAGACSRVISAPPSASRARHWRSEDAAERRAVSRQTGRLAGSPASTGFRSARWAASR